jgi:hypothetical protein
VIQKDDEAAEARATGCVLDHERRILAPENGQLVGD